MIRPASLERQYRRSLVGIIDRVAAAVTANLFPYLEGLAAEASATRPRSDASRTDQWAAEATRLIAALRLGLDRGHPAPRNLAQGFADDIGAWNDKEWRKVLRSVLGVELFQAEPWLKPELEAWAAENAALITSLEDDAVAQVERWTLSGLRAGQRHEEIRKKIEDRLDVSRSRAKLIARDQTAKLNADLTERRQTATGVTGYFWRTSLDERVRGNPSGKYPDARPSHWAKEGKRYKWSEPPADTGHPGQDYQCRCTAEPDLSGLISGLGEVA